MVRSRFLILSFSLALLVPFFTFSASTYPTDNFFSLRRNQGRTIGCDHSYTTLGWMSFPVHYGSAWPFFDVQIHRLDHRAKLAGNVGIGCRFAPACLDQVIGINAYYDFRDQHRTNFNQVGVGFELLGHCWNCRLNGYLPVGKKRILDSFCLFDDYIGSFFILERKYLKALKGCDFEIESHLFRHCCMNFYLGIGAYYYMGDKCRGKIYGSEYRLTAWFCDYLAFRLIATHDAAFKSRVQGEVMIRFPFDCCCGDAQRLFWPVERRDIIVLDKRSRWKTNF